jgi:predicted secreted protein
LKLAPSNDRIELLKQQWDNFRNGNLRLEDFKFGSGKKVWWICSNGTDHIWQTSIVKRINGGECPMCAGRIIVKSNCLQTTNPDLAKEWHPTRNGKLTPENVYGGSEKKVWWLCPKGTDHEYESQIKHRNVGVSCPICNGNKVIPSNSIATTHPDLISEWHPTKNIGISPTEVIAGSDKIVWWLCKTNPTHEWQARINKRTIRKQGCPACKGRIADNENNLTVGFPVIASQWNYKKNSPQRPEQFRARSNKKVWWVCEKDKSHSYPSTITNRVQGFGCPICAGRLVHTSNSLQTLFPSIAKQWHPTMNGILTPSDIVAGTNKKFWWLCEKGNDHEWQSTGANRIAVKNCPICEGLKVVKSNCLSTTHPTLALQWHPTKNETLTSNDVVAGSHKLVWWKCSQNPLHEWRASVKNRSAKQHGCPYCKLTPQSKQELTIMFELKSIFPSINPKGHYLNHDGKKWTIDIFIQELNLGIEFDGSYWHRDKDVSDKQKNNLCRVNGIEMLRIREQPLSLTSDFDIASSIPFSPKTVVNGVLQKIKTMFILQSDTLKLIYNYQLQPDIKAEKELDDYIRKLFRNKMERKKNGK